MKIEIHIRDEQLPGVKNNLSNRYGKDENGKERPLDVLFKFAVIEMARIQEQNRDMSRFQAP